MTNYYLNKRRTGERVWNILFIISIMTLMVIWWKSSNNYTDAVMKTDYCWDSQGNHFVVPDERCQ